MNKYILFGAGAFAQKAIHLIGKHNIEFIIDNDANKSGKHLHGIPIYYYGDKKKECLKYKIIIAVSSKYYEEINEELKKDGFNNFISINKIQCEVIKKKIEGRFDCIELYKKCMKWIKNNSVDTEAIICTSHKKKGYPEVSGYYIPTLIRWGYKKLAYNYSLWLLDIQKKNGAWYDTDDNAPYIFDTAQILKGLIAARRLYNSTERIDNAIIAGVEWIFSCMTYEGRLVTPDKKCWGNNEEMCSELIHLYCISPLIDAGRIFNKPEYINNAKRILSYYKTNYYDKIVNFSLLSHFYAYVVEAMLDLEEIDIARKAMKNIEAYQMESGAIPAYNDVDWVCSTGMLQLALIWFRLGELERGNKAFEYACKLQNESGGWYGSYISEENPNEENNYFPEEEISWANKYFLDALYYKNKAEFEKSHDSFLENIDKCDERYFTIKNIISEYHNVRILDLGCGKGRYIKNLLEDLPENNYYGVDISEKVMKGLRDKPVHCKIGLLTDVPYGDNEFTIVYTCEALEHAIDINSAIREMARITKSGGKIVIIDKNAECYGMMEIGAWEQWFDIELLKAQMYIYCDKVEVKKGLKYNGYANSNLFTAWIGTVR